MSRTSFRYVDLFAGIGGFHASLAALGGKCVFVSEIDPDARAVYARNWQSPPLQGDITLLANDEVMAVPDHEVLVAGFPCQPFSKSGKQMGMEETRGTLFWNILKIIEKKSPGVVILENVRNLAGPRHQHEWQVIIKSLRDEGYLVSEEPWIVSPHRIPPHMGGRPQSRERIFIFAVKSHNSKSRKLKVDSPPRRIGNWNPKDWNLEVDLPLERLSKKSSSSLTKEQMHWLDAWNDFVIRYRKSTGTQLPGFPLWGDEWGRKRLYVPRSAPPWKKNFIRKNHYFYRENSELIDEWAKTWNFYSEEFPPSRRKFEWQAGELTSMESTIVHLRPSGVRVKKATYAPALVAISQTPIVYRHKRSMSVAEASRLQGLPSWFSFGGQTKALSFKQLGNGVSVGAVWYVLKFGVNVYSDAVQRAAPAFWKCVRSAPESPDEILENSRRRL